MPTIQDRQMFSAAGLVLTDKLAKAAPRVMREVVIPIARQVEARYDSCQLRIYHVPIPQNYWDNELVYLQSLGEDMEGKRLYKCTGFNYEKAQRLLRHRQHCLSWQSKKDGDDIPHSERKHPGAVRAESEFGHLVGSCSGFNGLLDEFAIQALFVDQKMLAIPTLREMIEISNNTYSREYFAKMGVL